MELDPNRSSGFRELIGIMRAVLVTLRLHVRVPVDNLRNWTAIVVGVLAQVAVTGVQIGERVSARP